MQPSKDRTASQGHNRRVSSKLQTPAADSYRPQAPFLDELFQDDGTPRETARALVSELGRLGPEGLIEAGRRRDAIFMQQGITFETSSAGGPTHERPFPLDLVPRVLSGRNGGRSSAGWPSGSVP